MKGGIGKLRVGYFKDSFNFKFTAWSDCYILQLGNLQIGWIRK